MYMILDKDIDKEKIFSLIWETPNLGTEDTIYVATEKNVIYYMFINPSPSKHFFSKELSREELQFFLMKCA